MKTNNLKKETKKINMDRLERIKEMEEKFDTALEAVSNLDRAMENFENSFLEIEKLIEYYQSELWFEDFEADMNGELPDNLKRGILSEDGIYNLLTDYQRLRKLVGK